MTDLAKNLAAIIAAIDNDSTAAVCLAEAFDRGPMFVQKNLVKTLSLVRFEIEKKARLEREEKARLRVKNLTETQTPA